MKSVGSIPVKLSFLGIIVVLLVVSLTMYRSLENYTEEVQSVRNSNRLVNTVQLILSLVKDAETGHRGYQLTRDTIYLDPYYQAIDLLPGELKVLDSLVSASEDKRKSVDSLKALIQNQFLIISSILANTARTTQYMDQYESNLLVRGRKNMNAIRQKTEEIIAQEHDVIQVRSGTEFLYKTVTPIALITFAVIAIIAVTFLFTRVLQALNKKEQTEKLLQENVNKLQQQNITIEESKIILNEAETLAIMGSWLWSEQDDKMVWTDGLYRIFNKKIGEPVTWETFLLGVHHEDLQQVIAFLKEIKEEKKGLVLEYRIVNNYEIRNVIITAKPQKIRETDKAEILGTLLDISDQKEAEKLLRQSNIELKRSNENLEQFAQIASHDLQEPLRKIRAFGDRLMSRYKDDVDGADYVQRMQLAASRMQLLIDDLLSFSRVAHTEMNFEKLEMEGILSELVDDLDMLIKRQEATIKIDPMPSFYGNRVQIKRLFQNLISNGVKFHKKGTAPFLRISGAPINSSQVFREFGVTVTNEPHIRINVTDNGIGFDEKYLDKIFNIFQQLHGREIYEGTGIGLAICKKIVVNHQGFITARSIENFGSEFIVIFPLHLNQKE